MPTAQLNGIGLYYEVHGNGLKVPFSLFRKTGGVQPPTPGVPGHRGQ